MVYRKTLTDIQIMEKPPFSTVLSERRDALRAEMAAIFPTNDAEEGEGRGAQKPESSSRDEVQARGASDQKQPPAHPSAPLIDFVWEVGCGHGHFLTAYATAHPRPPCLGVDIASDRIARARKKAQRARLPHLHFLRAEASLFLEALPASARIAAVFILFPDPWPKSRYHKHRVLQPEFLEKIAVRAAPGCRLHFRTDFEPYYLEAKAVAASSSGWALVDAPWPFEFETVFQSRAAGSFHSFVAEMRSPAPAPTPEPKPGSVVRPPGESPADGSSVH